MLTYQKGPSVSIAGAWICAALLFSGDIYGQKGFAPVDSFSAEVHSKYPAHLDFKESMINDLKVPEGFRVSVVATGLGKPRIMALADNGSIYVTRRDVGDVLLLSGKDAKGRFTDLKTVWTAFPDVHGITIHNGMIYLASSKVLKKGRIQEDGTLTDTVTLLTDLPDGGLYVLNSKVNELSDPTRKPSPAFSLQRVVFRPQ